MVDTTMGFDVGNTLTISRVEGRIMFILRTFVQYYGKWDEINFK